MADVAATLERQGIARFVKSWDELIMSVTEEINKHGAQVNPEGSVRPVSSKNDASPIPAASLPA